MWFLTLADLRRDAYSFTRDQVPVSLTIYLKWQLTEPLKLTTHGYNTPYDALRCAQPALSLGWTHLTSFQGQDAVDSDTDRRTP